MKRLPQDFLAGIAEDPFGGIVPERDVAVVVHHHDGIHGMGAYAAELFFALIQGPAGFFPLADIPAGETRPQLACLQDR